MWRLALFVTALGCRVLALLGACISLCTAACITSLATGYSYYLLLSMVHSTPGQVGQYSIVQSCSHSIHGAAVRHVPRTI
jgi:hypothetical protein